MKRRVKEEPASEEPLGDNPVIVNDVVDDDGTSRMKKPKVSAMKELKVNIETLTFKPVVKQERRVQKARWGKKFMPGSSSRMVNIPDQQVHQRCNELEAAKALVGLSDPQPRTGDIHNLHISEDKVKDELLDSKDSNKEQKDSKEETDSIQETEKTDFKQEAKKRDSKSKEAECIVKKPKVLGKSASNEITSSDRDTDIKEEVVHRGIDEEQTRIRISVLKGIISLLSNKDNNDDIHKKFDDFKRHPALVNKWKMLLLKAMLKILVVYSTMLN